MRVDVGRKRAWIFASWQALGQKTGLNLRLCEVWTLRMLTMEQSCGNPDAVCQAKDACGYFWHDGNRFPKLVIPIIPIIFI
jgi:hypothetical protein